VALLIPAIVNACVVMESIDSTMRESFSGQFVRRLGIAEKMSSNLTVLGRIDTSVNVAGASWLDYYPF
jgi:hypothetical protein